MNKESKIGIGITIMTTTSFLMITLILQNQQNLSQSDFSTLSSSIPQKSIDIIDSGKASFVCELTINSKQTCIINKNDIGITYIPLETKGEYTTHLNIHGCKIFERINDIANTVIQTKICGLDKFWEVNGNFSIVEGKITNTDIPVIFESVINGAGYFSNEFDKRFPNEVSQS